MVVYRNAFRHSVCGFGFGDKCSDFTVLYAADTNALPEWSVVFFPRLRVRDINDVVFVDVNTARPSELLPFCKKLSLLVEDLDAIVRTVCNENPAA